MHIQCNLYPENRQIHRTYSYLVHTGSAYVKQLNNSEPSTLQADQYRRVLLHILHLRTASSLCLPAGAGMSHGPVNGSNEISNAIGEGPTTEVLHSPMLFFGKINQ